MQYARRIMDRLPKAPSRRTGARPWVHAVLSVLWLFLASSEATSGLAFPHQEVKDPAVLRKALETAEGPAAKHFWQGRLDLENGDLEAACRSFEEALELEGDDPAIYFWLGRAYGRQAQKDLGAFKKAAAARRSRLSFEKAVRLDPEFLEARLGLVGFHLVAPGLLGGDPDEAERQAREIARTDPYLGHLAWGSIQEHEERWESAARSFELAKKLRPREPRPYFRLIWLHQTRRSFAQAFAVLDELESKAPGLPQRLYELGRTAAFSGRRTEEGSAALEAYLEKPPEGDGPSKALVLSHLGMIHRHRGENDRALKLFQQASKLDPHLEGAHRNVAELERLTSAERE